MPFPGMVEGVGDAKDFFSAVPSYDLKILGVLSASILSVSRNIRSAIARQAPYTTAK